MDQDIASANIKSKIEDITDKICMENVSQLLLVIYKHVKQMIHSKYILWYGMTDKQIMQHVRMTRMENTVYALKMIVLLHIRKMKGTNLQLMNANIPIAERKTQVLKKFTIYRNPELLGLMNREKYAHIYTTFSCALKGCKQMLIIMIYNRSIETHCDALYIMMTGK